MRRLVTFILRLWIDPETAPLACEGQVECVATGERVHVSSEEDAVRFIQACVALDPDAEQDPHQESRKP